ncbi:hypothetical protein HZ326_10782 [Fusarium oxysporum f. sp. albedinis]|nr:hypothetical protein HZ326_10782 [Fusarium oxysporum f. sp. albedinis]
MFLACSILKTPCLSSCRSSPANQTYKFEAYHDNESSYQRDEEEVTLSYTRVPLMYNDLPMPNYTTHRIIFSEYIAGPAPLT